MPIIILQGVPTSLRAIERIMGKTGHGDILLANKYHMMLAKVMEWRDNPERTVVISSSVFRGEEIDGPGLATAVKTINPHAWFILFSLEPVRNQNVDAVIPKRHDETMYAFITPFLLPNPARFRISRNCVNVFRDSNERVSLYGSPA